MPEDKITLERGRFDWDAGRGYEVPADGNLSLPPGWGDAPEFRPREETAVVPREVPAQTAQEIMRQQEPEERVSLEDLSKLQEMLLASGKSPDVPSERVNLDNNTAVFRGHEITLSDDGRAAITTILAMEVCRVLDEEKNRVLTELGLFNQEVQGNTGGEPNVPEMQGPENPVEPEAPRLGGEVQ